MKVIIAEHSGFCFGVKRAMDMTKSELESDSNRLYSYGPLIHNPQAVDKLEKDGLITVEDYNEVQDGRIIIRSHGVPKLLEEEMMAKGLSVVDSTCPYVKAVHKRVEKYSSEGYNIVLIGNKDHPEVIGIKGYSQAGEAYVVNSLEEVNQLPFMDKICVVSQTTNTKEKFDILSEAIKDKGREVEIFNTICKATKNRQEATEDLAKEVDAMIVIGGYTSSNTRKLAEISRKHCDYVYQIETIKDLPLQELTKFNTIGITAGASTPDWIIKEAIEAMDNINKETNNEELRAEEVQDVKEGLDKKEEDLKVEEVAKEEVTEEMEATSSEEEAVEEADVAEENEEDLVVTEEDQVAEEEVEEGNNEITDEMMEALENTFTKIRRGDVIKGEVLFVTDNEVMVNINYKSDGIITRDELTSDTDVNPKDLYKQGDEIYVYVLRNDDGEGNVVLSAKRVEDLKKWDSLEENFKNKDILEAKVLRVVKGGLIALVDGVEGFIPASHVSVNYVSNLDSYVKQVLKVEIIDFDKEKRRLILSRKELEKKELEIKREALWDSLEENKIIQGTVQRLTDFGAFVDLGGVDGLIHISDLSWHRVKHPSEVVNPGDKVEVQVLSFDKEKNRISLGLKQTIEEPWVTFTKTVNVGDIVEGKVVNLLDFGAFIRLESGVDGLLHVSQISKEHVPKPSDVLSLGQEVKVKVIDINDVERKISLSIKEALKEEEAKEEEELGEAEETKEEPAGEDEVTIVNEDIDATIKDIINNK